MHKSASPNTINRIRCKIEQELVLSIFVSLFVVLTILMPDRADDYYRLVDWNTIGILSGLLLITTGLRDSGYFDFIALRLIASLKTERTLAISLILLSAIASTFLTNDITLFIIVPITLSVQTALDNDITKLIIFEAIAVNVGSALTPVGNPQNLYLWHAWGISFLSFVLKMLPMTLTQMVILLLFTTLSFSKKELKITPGSLMRMKYNQLLLWISSLLLVTYIVSIELDHESIMLPVIFAIYAIFFRKKVFVHVDWLLILLFTVIFVDFGVLSTTPTIRRVITSLWELDQPREVFTASAF